MCDGQLFMRAGGDLGFRSGQGEVSVRFGPVDTTCAACMLCDCEERAHAKIPTSAISSFVVILSVHACSFVFLHARIANKPQFAYIAAGHYSCLFVHTHTHTRVCPPSYVSTLS